MLSVRNKPGKNAAWIGSSPMRESETTVSTAADISENTLMPFQPSKRVLCCTLAQLYTGPDFVAVNVTPLYIQRRLCEVCCANISVAYVQ